MYTSVHNHPEAIQELRSATAWYEEQLSGLGDRFTLAIEEALERIQQWPNLAHLETSIGGQAIRARHLVGFPYRIVYFLNQEQKTIFIVAYAHDRRRPGYWKSRLTP